MPQEKSANKALGDSEHLEALGYQDSFHRSMTLWGNFALGFTYLSPLVGVYSLFALALSAGGPPSIFWLVIVGSGQMLVSLVFSEVVSQYPIHGGIYPWTRRLWGRRYAWMAAWVYIWAMIVSITAIAEFGSGFFASLFGFAPTKEITLLLSLVLLIVALVFNFTGTKTLARVAQIGLAAELVGVIGVGLYLLIFQRKHGFDVFFNSMGVEGHGSYLGAFLGAALAGLFLFYGFEACGDVAEEVANPARQIPKAMIMTILVGGVSALFAFGGYVLAAPDLQAIVSGKDTDPIPHILESTLGVVGAKIFLVVALTAFLSCVLSLQAAASRLLFSFARDGMIPGHRWLAKVSWPAAFRCSCAWSSTLARLHCSIRSPLSPCWASTSLSRQLSWPHYANASRDGARPGRSTSAAPASWSTLRRLSTASPQWCCSRGPAGRVSSSTTGSC
jgi:amino acid transporter